MARHDQSDYLAHFTTGNAPKGGTAGAHESAVATMSALDRLVAMLTQKKIVASTIPWTGCPAVCFTECPWSSLIAHAAAYSPYGIGFRKPHVFAAGGGPAFYVRPDHFKKQKENQGWHPHVLAFTTPFWPDYTPATLKSGFLDGKTVNYAHEREWRVPHDFTFEYGQVAFVVVDTYNDVAQFPQNLKDAIGREKFLMMDVYRQIEELWPVHKI